MRDAAIYSQQLNGGSIAILWGGLLTSNPSSWIKLMSMKYYGYNPHNTYIEPCSSNPILITPVVVISGINELPFVNYYKTKLPFTKIYRHDLTINGEKGKRIGEVVIIFDQNIGLEHEKVKQHIDEVQKAIVKKAKYNVFIDENGDNPHVRIIVFGIEKLPFNKFDNQRISTPYDLGQISHEINDEKISELAYITRDWLSYMSGITKAKKQVNEDTLRYLLCNYWERRISGAFITEENYKRFPSKEMDVKWKDGRTNYFMEIKYVSKNTDTSHELQRIFNDLYRLSLEKEYKKHKKRTKNIRCFFVIFGPSFLFEKHLRSHTTIYTGLHPNYTFNTTTHTKHILEECLSFYRDEPHKAISPNDITRSYYDNFNTEYDNSLIHRNFTTDLLELVLADNAFDQKQQSVAIWEVDRDDTCMSPNYKI